MRLNKRLAQFIRIPKIVDDCFLYFAQNTHLPFTIKRVYFITQANPSLIRGFHAHKKTQQVLFCLQGSIILKIDDGKRKRQILLDQPNKGLFLDKMIWHEMHEFKADTILLVLASTLFDARDYIRDYEKFIKYTKKA